MGTTLDVLTNRRGFALVIVLWIFIILIAVGAEFSGEMREDASATVNFAEETQSYYLANAAANRTFYRVLTARDEAKLGIPREELGEDEEPLVVVDGQWHPEELWGVPDWSRETKRGYVAVRVVDESGKIPINQVPEFLLRNILGNLGLDAERAAEVTDSLLDWIDDEDPPLARPSGAEDDYYLEQPQPHEAKDAKLDSLEELLLVRGVTWDLYNGGTEEFPVGLKQVFSIFNRGCSVSLKAAPPEVLRALFGLDQEQLQQILEQRAQDGGGSIGQLLIEMNPLMEGFVEDVDQTPNFVLVDVQAQMPGSDIAARLAAVIDVNESTEGMKILRWYDQLPIDERVPLLVAGGLPS